MTGSARTGRRLRASPRRPVCRNNPADEGFCLKAAEKIAMLEGLLKDVKTQGLRNALHLALKDLYKAEGDDAKMVEHLKAMVLENDQALQESPGDKKPREE